MTKPIFLYFVWAFSPWCSFILLSAPQITPNKELTSLGKMAHDLAGSWDQLHKVDFSKWIVASFDSGSVADGGSIQFNFITTTGMEFGLLIANPHYWMKEVNNEKLRRERQFFYLIIGKEDQKFFKIGAATKEEEIVVGLLQKALVKAKARQNEDRASLALAISHLKSRKVFPAFFDEEE